MLRDIMDLAKVVERNKLDEQKNREDNKTKRDIKGKYKKPVQKTDHKRGQG